ncbi:MAG: hypothetical protein J5863_09630 [Desulfovibrio sp.]|nr:hypothetical protein [Desulfovibrio sp.]
MSEYVVGSLYESGVQSWDAGCFFEMTGETCSLKLFWLDVTDSDVENVARGEGTFGLWYSNDGDVYFLFRFGQDPWADSVFSVWQMPEEKRIRPPKVFGRQHVDLEIVLVDAETGMVRAVRHAPLSVSFSRKLCASVARQYNDRYIASWSEEDFQKRCLKIYEEYPESGDISRAPGCILCQAAPLREGEADGEAEASGDGDD